MAIALTLGTPSPPRRLLPQRDCGVGSEEAGEGSRGLERPGTQEETKLWRGKNRQPQGLGEKRPISPLSPGGEPQPDCGEDRSDYVCLTSCFRISQHISIPISSEYIFMLYFQMVLASR